MREARNGAAMLREAQKLISYAVGGNKWPSGG
jgi:hypothetical protein